MDISETVTVTHKMKRGNYAVSDNDGHSDRASVGFTRTSIVTHTYTRSSYVRNGQGTEGGVCDCSVRNREGAATMCETYCVQRESLQHGFIQQKEWSSWSMAVTMGETSLVYTQTDSRGAQVCASSIRHLVRGVQVPPGKELVLTNESA
jgi:hypothetical protein